MFFRGPQFNNNTRLNQSAMLPALENAKFGIKFATLLMVGISLSACTTGSRSFFGDQMVTGSVSRTAMPTNLDQAMPAPAAQLQGDSLYGRPKVNAAANNVPFSPAMPINGGRKIQVVAQAAPRIAQAAPQYVRQAAPQMAQQAMPQIVPQMQKMANQGFIGEDQFITASVARSAPAQRVQQKMPIAASALPSLLIQQPTRVATLPIVAQSQTLPQMRSLPTVTQNLTQKLTTRINTSFSESKMSVAQSHVSPVLRRNITPDVMKTMPTMPNAATQMASTNGMAHTITAGESLYVIARRYNVSSDQLVAINKLASPDRIFVGQKLIIPGQTKAAVKSTITMAANTKPVKRNAVGMQKMSETSNIDYTVTGSIPAAKPTVAKAETVTSQKFRWPVTGRVVSDFSASNDTGISIDAPEGALVRSAENGSVLYVGKDVEWYGNLVLVKHSNGLVSAYAHLKDITVNKGDTIQRGGALGTIGMTGAAKRPQLHFELRKGAKPVNPLSYLSS